MKPSITSRPATDGQRKQLKRFAEDAIERGITEAKLGKDALQRVIRRGGEFQQTIEDRLTELSQELYSDEEVSSDYTYPKEYKVKPIDEQVYILAKIFSLSSTRANEFIARVLPKLKLPEGAEGWFAIPSIDAVATRFFPEVIVSAKRYQRAVDLVHERIAAIRHFESYEKGRTSAIVQTKHTIRMLAKIGEIQPSEILIIPAQFGHLHRGRSVRRVRELFTTFEFGLGCFEVGCMLITHPDRLTYFGQLEINCPGDAFDLDWSKNGNCEGSPCYFYNGGNNEGLKFGGKRTNCYSSHYGSVSSFFSFKS